MAISSIKVGFISIEEQKSRHVNSQKTSGEFKNHHAKSARITNEAVASGTERIFPNQLEKRAAASSGTG